MQATLRTLERLGIARERFLHEAQFDLAWLDAIEGRISASEFSRLCELVLDLSGDPALGLHEGEVLGAASVNIVGSLMAHATSLRQGLQALLRMHKLLDDQPRYQLIEGGHLVTLRCAGMQGVSARVRRFMAEVEVTAFGRVVGYFVSGARPEQVNFEHAAPDYRREYARVFGGLERFEQPPRGAPQAPDRSPDVMTTGGIAFCLGYDLLTSMRFASIVAVVFALIVHSAAASAQDRRFPWFARGGLGVGYGVVDSRMGYEEPSSDGAGLLWDAAVGVFVTRWLALHGSAFGGFSPNARPSTSCVDNCGPERREHLWAQTYGAGLTLSPDHGIRGTRLRPFLSVSAGLAIVGAQLMDGVIGAGTQTLLGLEYEVRHGLRVGVGVQGMFEGKRPRKWWEDNFKAFHFGGILTVSFDRRR